MPVVSSASTDPMMTVDKNGTSKGKREYCAKISEEYALVFHAKAALKDNDRQQQKDKDILVKKSDILQGRVSC